jgi:hypothetical protein
MTGTRFAARPFLAAVTVVAAAVVVACGGDDDGSAAPRFDPADADAIAHAAMLTAKDLPGTGWVELEVDSFDDSEIPAETAACRAIEGARTAVRESVEAGRAGRAQVSLGREGDDGFATEAESRVNIFRNADVPARAFAAAEKAYSAKNVTDCFRDAVVAGVDPSITVEAKSATPLATVPKGGLARAVLITLSDEDEDLELRFEVYIWRDSNAGVTVSLNGTVEGLTREVARAAVRGVDEKLAVLAQE